MAYNKKNTFNAEDVGKYVPNAAVVSNATDSYLKNEGIINTDEQFETIYLAEDEIEKFMEKYLLENPDTEIETRYLNQPPVEVIQDIEVRWLRPETPEIPPIIIKEIVESPHHHRVEPTIRIVQTRKEGPEEKPQEPTIIREKPPIIPIPEPKFAYVQNVIKRQVYKQFFLVAVGRVLTWTLNFKDEPIPIKSNSIFMVICQLNSKR